jgi:hypothetical protein
VLKGAALAETLYGNPAVRPMCDVDLLVREEQVPDALNTLTKNGYTATPPRGYKAEVSLSNGSRGSLPLELHWNLFVLPYYRYALSQDWFWNTAIPLTLPDGNAALMLGWEAQVLHLCGHLHLHHFGSGDTARLLWLQDIAEVVARFGHSLDWDHMIAIAQSGGLAMALRNILEFVIEKWDLPVPEGVNARLAALNPSAMEERVAAGLRDISPNLPHQLYKDLRSLPDWKSRTHFLWTNFFPPPRYMYALYRLRPGTPVLAAYVRRWRDLG